MSATVGPVVLRGEVHASTYAAMSAAVLAEAAQFFGTECLEIVLDVATAEPATVSHWFGGEPVTTPATVTAGYRARVLHRVRVQPVGPPKCPSCQGSFWDGFEPAPWVDL